MKRSPPKATCPCGSGQSYATCCGPAHQGQPATTAEALMRSRYSAYVLGLEPYLLATWADETRPASLELQAPPPPQWLGLKVLSHQIQDESHAEVSFIARYKLNGRAHRLEERSRFEKRHGQWFYVDGQFPTDGQ